MSYQIGTATDVGDLLNKLDAFLTVGHALEPTYTGVGTGRINGLIGTPASVLETITVTFSGAADFTVAGSVSGALGAGTVGVAFACGVCAFTIAAGGTAWAAGDTIAFMLTPKWQQKRFSTTANSLAQFCCWQAPGNDGVSAIYVGVQRVNDATGDYDNLKVHGFTGYQDGIDMNAQPGYMGNGPILPLMRTGAMPYWFVADGRRVAIVVKCSTVYESAYLGFINCYANPSQFPYPLAIGGSMAWAASTPAATSINWRWSYQGNEHMAYPLNKCYSANVGYDAYHTLRMRSVSGAWRGFTANAPAQATQAPTGTIWPYNSLGNDYRQQADNSYALLPVVLTEDTAPYVYAAHGELSGVFHVTGYGNAAENTITDAGKRLDYLVVQNVYRNTQSDYYALKLA